MQFRLKKALLGAFAAFGVLALTGCENGSVYGYEKDLSSVNEVSWHLWRGAWLAAAVVGIFTAALILWPVLRHRRKEGDPQYPKQTQYNVPVEVAYTVIPFIIVAVLFYFTARDETTIIAKEPSKVMHTIDVTGIQWSWQFGHQDGGAKAVVTGTPANPPTLVLPLGERVKFNIHSNDVVHGMSRFCHLVNPQKKSNCKRRTFRTRSLNLRALQQLAYRLGKGGRKTVQAAR